MLTRLTTIAALMLWVVHAVPTTFKADEGPGLKSHIDAIRQAKSKQIRKYMNESVDPCQNFYQFACGNWKTHHPADEDHIQKDAITVLGSEEFDRKLSLLLALKDHSSNTATERKVKEFYGSCLKLGSLKQSEYNAKKKEILKEFGQMPALVGDDKWQEQDFDWLQTIAEISNKYNIRIIVGPSIVPNHQDPTKHIMYLRIQDFKMQYNFDSQRTIFVLNVMKQLKRHLDFEDKLAEKIAKEMVDLEGKLWKAKQHDMETQSEEISIKNAQKKYSPEFNVEKLFNISYGSIPSDVKIDICPYIESLIEIMRKTPKRVVANYIFYQLLQNFAVKISSNTKELEKLCVCEAEKYFPRVVSYLFNRKNKLKENEIDLMKMWQYMKTTLKLTLESTNLKWFDDNNRKYALDNLQSMKLAIPFYEENNFELEYANLTISPGDYIENKKALMAFKAAQARMSLKVKPNLIDYGLDIYSPVYVQTGNVAIVPVSVLQTDFYWSKFYPKALNYAHLGFLIAHEVQHGFSGSGFRFDRLGNYMGSWDIEDLFEERRRCLYDQYHNYTFGGQPLPQDKTQEENTADNGGVLLTYETYRRWYEEPVRTKAELELEMLPHLNYDYKQLFFIAYSQNWCADAYETQRSIIAASDEHSPDEFRAFVPLTNLPEFAKAFQCPKGSPMNPENKCVIF